MSKLTRSDVEQMNQPDPPQGGQPAGQPAPVAGGEYQTRPGAVAKTAMTEYKEFAEAQQMLEEEVGGGTGSQLAEVLTEYQPQVQQLVQWLITPQGQGQGQQPPQAPPQPAPQAVEAEPREIAPYEQDDADLEAEPDAEGYFLTPDDAYALLVDTFETIADVGNPNQTIAQTKMMLEADPEGNKERIRHHLEALE